MTPPAQPASAHRWYIRLGYAAVLVAIAAASLFWSALTPAAVSVDEPVHVNSVIRLMQGGGWPPPRTAPVLEATGVATVEAGRPWMDRTWDDMPVLEELPAPEERSVVGHLDTPLTHDGEILIDWMNQHPPTWYAIAAGAMTVLGADEWRWDQLYFGLRTVSMVFVTGAAAFILAGVRRLTGSPAAAMVGTLALFTSAQFFNVLSMATNDSLAIFAGAGMLFFLVRALTSADRSWPARWLDTLGAAGFLGIGLLTKGTALTAIPVVGLAILVAGVRAGGSWFRRLLPAAVSMVVAFAIGGWYYARNILVFGEIQSSNSGTGRNAEPFDGYSFLGFLEKSVSRFVTSFWESTRPYLDLPGILVGGLLLGTVIALIVVLVRAPERTTVLILLVYPACVIGLIFFHAWEIHWNNGRLVGLQGRYLFPAMLLYCGIVGLAWRELFGRAHAVVRASSAAVLGAGFVVVNLYGMTRMFQWRWSDAGASLAEQWTAMAHGGPLSAGAVGVIAVTAAAAAAIAVAMTAVTAARHRAPARV